MINIGSNCELYKEDTVSLSYTGDRTSQGIVNVDPFTVAADSYIQLGDFFASMTADAAEVKSGVMVSASVLVRADNSGNYPYVEYAKVYNSGNGFYSAFSNSQNGKIIPSGSQVKIQLVFERPADPVSETASVTYKTKLKFVEFINAV